MSKAVIVRIKQVVMVAIQSSIIGICEWTINPIIRIIPVM
ncbi:hypothetical protein J2T14_005977 [Paenibacillus harenae]|nr:hypothetical protein [Paenibacillus harenae]